jgi:hypothetical protein
MLSRLFDGGLLLLLISFCAFGWVDKLIILFNSIEHNIRILFRQGLIKSKLSYTADDEWNLIKNNITTYFDGELIKNEISFD